MKAPSENNRIFLLLLDVLCKFIFSKGDSKSIAKIDADTLELLCREADDNLLGLLLYYYCGKDQVLPDLWQDKWSADFRRASAGELRQADELVNIFKILADNDIEAAPLKGVCLAYHYYPHPALRGMSDFDILIRPESVKKAFQVMLDNNFTSDYNFGISYHEPQLSSPRGFLLELHTHITPDFYRCTYDVLWQDCLKSEFKGQQISRLSPEISLLHTINHAFRDNLIGGLKGFIDVAYIFANSDINFKQLEELAKENCFYDELTLFMNIFPTFFPDKYVSALEDAPADILEDARYLVYNSKHAQNIDKRQLMLYREYGGLSFLEKLLFMKGRMNVKSVSVAKTYNCRPHSPMLIYYYFHRAYTNFIELALFEKKSKRSSLTRYIGTYQNRIHSYLNDNVK